MGGGLLGPFGAVLSFTAGSICNRELLSPLPLPFLHICCSSGGRSDTAIRTCASFGLQHRYLYFGHLLYSPRVFISSLLQVHDVDRLLSAGKVNGFAPCVYALIVPKRSLLFDVVAVGRG